MFKMRILNRCLAAYLHKSKIVNCGVNDVSAQLKTAGIPYIDYTRKTPKNLRAA